MPFFPFFYDSSYIILLPAIILAFYAQMRVSSTFSKYSQVRNTNGLTGADVARRILSNAGIYDVRIERVAGNLTDHYDSRNKVLRLSDTVYNSMSVSAIGVAAHECGHAIQDQQSYGFLRLRNAFVPIASIGSQLAFPLIMIGLFFTSSSLLINVGIILFSVAVLFHFITLPVEFDASRRAISILDDRGLLGTTEIKQAKKVLNAAALTYVASAFTAVLQLLRLLLITGGRRRD